MSANKVQFARHTTIDNVQDMFSLPDEAINALEYAELISYKTPNGEPRQVLKAVASGITGDNAKDYFKTAPRGSVVVVINASSGDDIYLVKRADEASNTQWVGAILS